MMGSLNNKILTLLSYLLKFLYLGSPIKPYAPVALKVADEVVLDVSKMKESSFINRTSLTPSDF